MKDLEEINSFEYSIFKTIFANKFIVIYRWIAYAKNVVYILIII